MLVSVQIPGMVWRPLSVRTVPGSDLVASDRLAGIPPDTLPDTLPGRLSARPAWLTVSSVRSDNVELTWRTLNFGLESPKSP